jgi:PAS domain S-box-containing protein
VNRAASAAAAQRLALAAGAATSLSRLAELTAGLTQAPAVMVSLFTDVQIVIADAGMTSDYIGKDFPLEPSIAILPLETRAPVVLEDAAHDGRAAKIPAVAAGRLHGYLAVPLIDSQGHGVGALCLFDMNPRRWTQADVDLTTQLAEFVVTELELVALVADYKADKIRWDLASTVTGLGSFEWDLTTRLVHWDRQMMDLYGLEAPEPAAGDESSVRTGIVTASDVPASRIHPDDLPKMVEQIREVIARGGLYDLEYRVIRNPTDTRWVRGTGVAQVGPDGTVGRVLGAVFDITPIRDSESRVARVLESISAAFFSIDHEWRFSYVNAAAETALGFTREQLIGQKVWDMYPKGNAGGLFLDRYEHALRTGQPVTFENKSPTKRSTWYEVRVWPGADGISVYLQDISARRLVEQAAERDAERLRLLAQTSEALAGTLDAEEAMERLAEAVVPALGDWCIVTLAEDDGVRDVGLAHGIPEKLADVRAFVVSESRISSPNTPIREVLRTGRPLEIGAIPQQAIETIFPDPAVREILTRLNPTSGTAVPMTARGRTLGVLAAWNSDNREPHTPSQVDTMREIGRRAALAVDNAQLYAAQRGMAETLQRSLLNEPLQPEHLEIAVRYRPAAQEAQVGGDWYDAFRSGDGSTCVVIGDVAGHDREAAAAMGQVRNLLRGVAYTLNEPPAAVLTTLDRALAELTVDALATGVLVKIAPEPLPGGACPVRWSNAGHPPPVLMRADGSVEFLEAEIDLLLGIDPTTDRGDHECLMQPGETLLLYTDGLVEQRGQGLDEGLDWLLAAASHLATMDLQELCDHLLSQVSARGDDDIALLAIRPFR